MSLKHDGIVISFCILIIFGKCFYVLMFSVVLDQEITILYLHLFNRVAMSCKSSNNFTSILESLKGHGISEIKALEGPFKVLEFYD